LPWEETILIFERGPHPYRGSYLINKIFLSADPLISLSTPDRLSAQLAMPWSVVGFLYHGCLCNPLEVGGLWKLLLWGSRVADVYFISNLYYQYSP
jgi:hypothetical protein